MIIKKKHLSKPLHIFITRDYMHWENIHIHVYYAKHVVILYKTNTKC